MSLNFHDKLLNFKAHASCFDFLNLNNHHHSITICAPSFIRSDRHPSFTVYQDHCIDWADGNHYYDIFDLYMLKHNCSLSQAYQQLTGQPLFDKDEALNFDQSLLDDDKALQKQIDSWLANLLNDPIINYKGQDLHLLSQYLARRGITRETAIRMRLGFNPNSQRLVIPCIKNNKTVYYISRDLTGNCEHSRKYMKAKKDSNLAFQHTFWGHDTLRNPSARSSKTVRADDGEDYSIEVDNPRDYTLVIAEGALDYASFLQDGWQVISPACGHFLKQDLPEIISIARSYKNVCVCFDNDNAGQAFTLNFCKLLFSHRIHFTCAHTHAPDGSDAKFDVNDYYSHGGDLEQLVRQAKNGLAELAASFETEDELYNFLEKAARFASPIDIDRIFRELLKLTVPNPEYDPDDKTSEPFVPKYPKSMLRLLFKEITRPAPEKVIAEEVLAKYDIIYNYNDSFYKFTGSKWEAISEVETFGFVSECLGRKATAGKCRAIVQHLKAMAGQHARFDMQHIFAFANGVLDLDSGTFYYKSCTSKEIRKAFMNTIVVNYNYDCTATAREWRRFLERVSKGKPQVMKQLQKAAGYILFADNRLQKMFALYGTGANGKSIFTQALQDMLGSENCSNLRPDRLASPFDGIALQGKAANFCYEARRSLDGAEETLKAVVSGDPFMAAHKGVDAVSFTSRAKWFINMNDVMETTDISWGFLRRLLFLPFEATFKENEADRGLQDKLRTELPGIFNWAYQGYKMLMTDMKFEDLEEHTRIMELMMSRVDNSFSFFCDSYRYNANDFLDETERQYYPTSKDIWEQYKSWCTENGEKPKTKKEFQEAFKTLMQKYRPDVVMSAPYHQEGVRGQIVKFYIPEVKTSLEGDYFIDLRDENGRVPGQDGYIDHLGNVETVEPVEPVEAIEAMSNAEIEAGIDELLGTNNVEYLAEQGKSIYYRCMMHLNDWWTDGTRAGGFMNDFDWRALAAYLKDKPIATESINFKQHFSDYLRNKKGHTSDR